jgi:mannose-6-phosphate isomerase-like protein (cupin superfamily)
MLPSLPRIVATYTAGNLFVLKSRSAFNRPVHPLIAWRMSFVACAIFALIAPAPACAQPTQNRGCAPVSERTGEIGCWIIAREQLGELSHSKVFWDIESYSSRAEAEAAKRSHGTVVEALGKIWLFTIADAADSTSGDSARVARIGPLTVKAGEKYVAQYMEGITTPGTTTPVHRHPGPEVWYTLAGQACLETPVGKAIATAG